MRTDELVRIIVHDHTDAYVCEIDPAQVTSAVLVEQVNGEHSLTLTTSQELAKTDRLIVRDGMGVWHEYVVLGIESEHANGGVVLHEHYCVWSLQYDLSATYVNDQFGCGVVPGHASVPQTARKALECALEGTARWTIGTITVTDQSSASFYRRSGWDAMKTVLERWGGELQATITVSTTGVVGRAVDLLAHVGSDTATRRFDYGADLTGIKRTFADEVWPCRIVPLGKSMETENGGYTRRPGIESVNGGVEWLQDDSVVAATRVPNGSGGWEYPTSIVTNDTYEDPAELKAWALEHISDYTTPKVTYEATVAQFAEAGLDPHGVALGDRVAIVDRTFGDGLRLAARVTKIKRDLVDPARAELSIGNADTSLAAQLGDISRQLAELSSQVSSGSEYQTGNAYLDALLNRINAEINATGGYTYITQGEGIRTYDVPVSDPLVGSEASKVVEVKGGNIRIADTKDSAGNWEWRTLIQSGHIASDLIDAITIHSGYIGNYQGNSYWDLDNSNFLFGYTFEPLISDTSITVNAQQVVGSSKAYLAPNESYIIAFTTTGEIDQKFKAGIAMTAGSTGPKESSYPTVVSMSNGSIRYMATVEFASSYSYQMRAYFTYAGTYDSSAEFTATDVRVYKKPSTGDGVMRFEASSNDDSVSARMLAGLVSVSSDDVTSELMPGLLSLSDIDVPTALQMAPDIGAYYKKATNELLLGKHDGSAGATISLAPSTTPNKLPGMLDYTGMLYHVDSTVADVFSPATGFTLTRGYRLTWGPVVVIQVLLTTPNISARSSGTAQRLVGNVKPTPLSNPIAVGQLGSTGSSKPLVLVTDDTMSYRSSGASAGLYLPADHTRTTDIASGTRLAIIAIYLVKP